jgi:hypothetical protein
MKKNANRVQVIKRIHAEASRTGLSSLLQNGKRKNKLVSTKPTAREGENCTPPAR